MWVTVKSPENNISSPEDIEPDTIYVGFEVSEVAFVIGNKDNTKAPLLCLYHDCSHIRGQSWKIIEENQ